MISTFTLVLQKHVQLIRLVITVLKTRKRHRETKKYRMLNIFCSGDPDYSGKVVCLSYVANISSHFRVATCHHKMS